jgi:WD40 repeat protein
MAMIGRGGLTWIGGGLLILLAGAPMLGALAATTAPPSPAANEPPADPFLRIETGMHTAVINRIAVDASGRLAATAADDKTIRLWSLPEGKPAGVLRVPIGSGPEGSLYSVALSSDGKTLAAAGQVGAQWDGRPSLYLFDVPGQRIKARLPNLPSEIFHLAFSPDGKRLAAAFGGGAGLVVYDMANGRVLGADPDYGRQPANWAAFDAEGRLATTGFDGFVRLYDPNVKLIAKTKLPGSGRPFSVAFSPDGGLLAVGSFDKPRVDLFSASDLKPRLGPETADLKTGNLAAVAWIKEGRQISLAAGGTTTNGAGDRIIRVWPNAGMGRAVDIAVAKDSINQIEPLGEGEALFVSADPAWGRISASRRLMRLTSNIANFRDIHAGRLAISDDGLTLEFGIAHRGQQPMRLDLRAQSYTPAPQADRTLAVPIVTTPAIKITGWQNTQEPMLGTRKLALDGVERARSLAISPDGRSFLLGGDYSLRLYDAKGSLIEKIELAAAVSGIVINRPGTMAVAALTDGTLHWYSLGRNGRPLEERATLFVHADGRRWVAWTPEGFFEHAEDGGKDLVGYHFNKGKAKAAEFINFAQVYSVFHSSDLLIKKIVGGQDDEIARVYGAIGDLRFRLEKRPLPGIDLTEYCWTSPGGQETCRPISEITTRGFARDTSRQAGVEAGSATPTPAAPIPVAATPPAALALAATVPEDVGDLKLRFKVVDRGGGIGDIAVYLNERNIDRTDATRAFRRDKSAQPGPAAAAPGGNPTAAGDTLDRRIALAPGVSRIEIRAYDGTGTAFATSRKVEVTRVAPTRNRDAAALPPAKPRLFVLAAGIDRYKRPEHRLRFPVADAEGVAAALKERSGDLYGKILVPKVGAGHAVSFVDFTGGKAALANDDASRETLENAFAALTRDGVIAANDTVVIYLAGHGTREEEQEGKTQAAGKFYFITANVDGPESVRSQALGQDALLGHLVAINNKKAHILLVLDTCHSGAFAKGTAMDAIANLNDEAGISVLAAAASNQEALDGYRPQGTGVAEHGVFAFAMIAGLSGGATADENGIIYPGFLAQYVKKAVVKLAQEVNPNHRQQAKWQSLGEQEEFPLAKKQR